MSVRGVASLERQVLAASPVEGSTTSALLSILGADEGGEAGLTYTWAVLSAPSGAEPQFTLNGSNAAKNTSVALNAAGSYVFVVTISDGESTATSSVLDWAHTASRTGALRTRDP